MNCVPQNAAQRLYLWRFGVAMGFYLVFLFSAVLVFKHGHPEGPLMYGLAVLPALPILAVLVVVGVYLGEEKDEFERTVLVQSMLWGIGGTLALTTVWGFLEMFAPVSHFQPFWAFPVYCVIVGVATPLVRWRYR